MVSWQKENLVTTLVYCVFKGVIEIKTLVSVLFSLYYYYFTMWRIFHLQIRFLGAQLLFLKKYTRE